MTSALLFNLALDIWIKKLKSRDIKVLAYADDMAVIINCQQQYNSLLLMLIELDLFLNLKLSHSKTKVTLFNWKGKL